MKSWQQQKREHEEWRNKILEVGKVKHYKGIIDEFNRTKDKTLLLKVKYGCGYIDGVCGKRHKHTGENARYYDYGFEAGTKDKAWHDKKKG